MNTQSFGSNPAPDGAGDAGNRAQALANRFAVPVALVVLYIVWGSTYLGIRYAIETIPPFLMASIRFLVAGVLLYVLLRARGAPNPSPRQWLSGTIVGVLLLAGGNGLVGFGEQYVASGLAAVLIGTVPLWAALFAGIWGLWPRRLESGGLVVGFLGLAVLNTSSGLHGHPLAAGILIFAAISWAFGSVWSRSLPMPPGMMASATEMLTGGVVLLAMSLVRGERFAHGPSPTSVWALIYLIVFGSFIAFTAYNYLLQHVRPALATSYAYVNPMVAVILGVALVGEKVSASEVVALLIVVTGVGLVIMGRQRQQAESSA
ncbi:MAG: drug/metabolite exporter YedA [Chloroflexota bacterium]